jgi:heterodisulfide reductase subunit A-like polyferredoxin
VTWDEVNTGYTAEQAVAEAERCLDCAICSECMECVRACGPGAIDWDQTETVEELSVGAVVLATGFTSSSTPRARRRSASAAPERADAGLSSHAC